MGAPALLRRWTCAFSPQVSLEKEAAGLAGLLPGGERVSAGVWRSRPRAIPGSPTCARSTTNVRGRREIDAVPPPPAGGWESVSSAPCTQEAGPAACACSLVTLQQG